MNAPQFKTRNAPFDYVYDDNMVTESISVLYNKQSI